MHPLGTRSLRRHFVSKAPRLEVAPAALPAGHGEALCWTRARSFTGSAAVRAAGARGGSGTRSGLSWTRSALVWTRSALFWTRSALVWTRSALVWSRPGCIRNPSPTRLRRLAVLVHGDSSRRSKPTPSGAAAYPSCTLEPHSRPSPKYRSMDPPPLSEDRADPHDPTAQSRDLIITLGSMGSSWWDSCRRKFGRKPRRVRFAGRKDLAGQLCQARRGGNAAAPSERAGHFATLLTHSIRLACAQ